MSDTSGFQQVRSSPSPSQWPVGSLADNRIIPNWFLAPFLPQDKSRIVMTMVYLSALCTNTLLTYLSPEQGHAQPITGIDSPIPLHPLQLPALANPLPDEELRRLNTIARNTIQKSPIQSKTVVGIHHALLNPSVVQQVLKSSPATSAPKVIILLPNKQSAIIVTDSLEASQGSVMWKGHADGALNSRIRLIVNVTSNAINGSIEKGRFIYEIRPSPSNTNVLEILTIDPSGFPPEHGSVAPHRESLRPASVSGLSTLMVVGDRASKSLNLAAGGNPPVIDVMILYTRAAKDQDPSGIGAMACLAVEDLKDALTKSGIQATARLVYHGEANNFTEDLGHRIGEDLENLRAAGNTPTNEIYMLRDNHKADIVSLWVSEAKGTDCGMSPPLAMNKTPSNALAFSVVRRSCARNNRSFVHEVGHILQANHDRYQEQAGQNPDYNYGYVKADEGWMTVMSYDRPDCPWRDIYDNTGQATGQQRHVCNRLLYWSSPLVTDPILTTPPTPMGQAAGTSPNGCTDDQGTQQQKFNLPYPTIPPIVCDGPADNARVLNDNVATVAGFRSANTLANVSCITSDVVPPATPSGLNIR